MFSSCKLVRYCILHVEHEKFSVCTYYMIYFNSPVYCWEAHTIKHTLRVCMFSVLGTEDVFSVISRKELHCVCIFSVWYKNYTVILRAGWVISHCYFERWLSDQPLLFWELVEWSATVILRAGWVISHCYFESWLSDQPESAEVTLCPCCFQNCSIKKSKA